MDNLQLTIFKDGTVSILRIPLKANPALTKEVFIVPENTTLAQVADYLGYGLMPKTWGEMV